MKARGLLMIEHRLIEKMLILAKNRIELMNTDTYDPILVENIVDFIKMYADRTHHGKEEEILFKDLGKKELNKNDREIMKDLIDEHKQARNKVKEIISLNEKYKEGDKSIVVQMIQIINWLSVFYPVHIKKEDSVFFPNADKYFSNLELDELLKKYYAFDARMIHEKYQNLYDLLTK